MADRRDARRWWSAGAGAGLAAVGGVTIAAWLRRRRPPSAAPAAARSPHGGSLELAAVLAAAAAAADVPPWRLSVTVADDAARVADDPARLERLATDLLANAVRHGRIDDTVSVRGWLRDGDLLLSVTDEGRGPARLSARRLPARPGRAGDHAVARVTADRGPAARHA